MAFVLDASVTACWFLTDEAPEAAETALELLLQDGARAPRLWWFEVRNLLLSAERRGRIDRTQTSQALDRLAALEISIDTVPDSEMVIHLARQYRLSVYDAAYLELAMRERVPLATLDKSLAAAAKAEGVVVLGDTG
jgi:predicted nucleic acid-binding protein